MNKDRNIILPEDKDCAFCSYLRGDRPYTILWRDDKTATFVTREQRGLPHLLVLPIRHTPTILDLDADESGSLLNAIKRAAQAIDDVFKRPGIAVWQNNGVSAGQSICHLHFHVAGTLDKGGTEWGTVPELDLSTTDDIAERLRKA